MKRLSWLLVALLCTGCAQSQSVPEEPELLPEPEIIITPEPEPEPEPEPTQEELDAMEIQALIDTMTLEEKVGQLFFVRCPSELAVEDIQTYHLGGYVLFGRDTAEQTTASLTATIASYQQAATIPLLIGVDEEGGTVVRVSANSQLDSVRRKSPQALFNAGGMDAIVQDAAEKSAVLLNLGFNVNLAPVADVSTVSGEFMYPRTLGQDAAATADYVEQVVTAMDSAGIGSVLKHFPGYGNNMDTHTGIALDPRPLETFETADLLPFQSGVNASDTAAILVSHNIIQAVDETLPASLSPDVHDWLRESLAFDGVVMTDDLAMDAVKAYAVDGAVSAMAIEAGNDLVITSDYRTQIPITIAAVEDGTISLEQIETACRRVLTWKQTLNLL